MLLQQRIVENFSRRAASYDAHAGIQLDAANRLADTIARNKHSLPAGPILEIGCGTGNLTLPLLSLFADRQTYISDLSPTMLARARRGWYSDLEVSRGLTPEMRAEHFRRAEGGWQVNGEVQRLVEFLPVNLVEPWPALPPMDVVLLRNVMIYFDAPTRRQILGRLRQVLRPDGYLLLGGAETTHNLDDGFEPVAVAEATFYRLRRA